MREIKKHYSNNHLPICKVRKLCALITNQKEEVTCGNCLEIIGLKKKSKRSNRFFKELETLLNRLYFGVGTRDEIDEFKKKYNI